MLFGGGYGPGPVSVTGGPASASNTDTDGTKKDIPFNLKEITD